MTGASTDPSSPARRTTDQEDLALLERLRRDERDAMAGLYDRYGRIAFGLAYRIVGEPSEAEDVVQESFLSLWRQAGRLDPERGSVRSYLLTIVHRRSVDVLRRRSGHRERKIEDVDAIAAAVPDPIDFVSQAEERQLVRRAVGELSPHLRQAIELTYFQGLTVAELAERAEIPLGTAKSRMRLALERMRKTMVAR